MTEWQPIETGPKDGSNFLGYEDKVISVMCWENGWWLEGLMWPDETTYCHPTHWMPIPEPPK